jgi:hypothetical protein
MNVRAPHTLVPLALLALAAGACGDRGPTTSAAPPPAPAPSMALECRANVPARQVTCAPPAGTAAAGGARFDLHTLGGQGLYVRLASSSVDYAGGVFSFDLTMQNLSTLAFATADGAARDDEGVRVFFHSGPTVTGGAGVITVDNETGTGTFTAAGQPYFQYGGKIAGVDQGDLGADGILASAETSTAKSWALSVPGSVTTFSFLLLVSTQTPAGAIATAAPQVSSVAPATLVPGSTATLTGINFSATPGDNAVTVGGVAATVTAATTTTLDVTVPCVATGDVAVQVTKGGMKGAPLTHPLDVADITLAAGESVVLDAAGEGACNEITPSGGLSDYVVAVYNTGEAPLSTAEFQLSGDAAAGGPAAARAPHPSPRLAAALRRPAAPPPGLDAAMALARQQRADEAHYRLLERNRAAYRRLQARFRGDPRMRASRGVVAADPPPTTATFKVANIDDPDFCDHSYSVDATRVFYDGKLAIYEDDDNPITDAGNATLAAYYDSIGAQFNADMEPVVTDHFGNPLLRDASTDANGVVVALFTRVVNDSFPGVAGFVVSCDQYPSGAGNSASNFGEYFYAMVPTSTAPGYASGTMDSWYWSIRATFIHETKHVASFSARVASAAASFEESWLEEGMARHAEELWAREAVYNVAWKANTGYGSAATPGSLYCDYRRTDADCLATDPARPSLNLFRHFSGLYTFLDDPVAYSPFGPTALGGSSFYATSWSLVRYAVDRYAASEAAFLTAVTGASSTGTDNLATVAGVPIETLLGGWALALFADDYPGLGGAGADIDMPTWNFTDIYAGLNDDFSGTFPAVYPLVPTAVAFGSFGPLSVPSIVGGGVKYYQFAGTHTTPQLLRLEAAGGGTPPADLRMAVARLE